MYYPPQETFEPEASRQEANWFELFEQETENEVSKPVSPLGVPRTSKGAANQGTRRPGSSMLRPVIRTQRGPNAVPRTGQSVTLQRVRRGDTLGGPGVVGPDFFVNNMSPAAADYQTRAGGLPKGMGYYVSGYVQREIKNKKTGQARTVRTRSDVQFDGYQQGRLIDTKFYEQSGKFVRSYHAFMAGQTGEFANYASKKAAELLQQARDQLDVAGKVPIVWRVPSVEARTILRQLFRANNVRIDVELYP
jgi:hypothetical protein